MIVPDLVKAVKAGQEKARDEIRRKYLMNERIEKYLKQHHCRDYFNSYGETVEDDHYFMYREEVDGLVELIVRETLEQMAIQMDKFGNSQANNTTWYKSQESVKKHFGVEE